jgi:DsbC/DsbD-like thiol-disulfide interchange protein
MSEQGQSGGVTIRRVHAAPGIFESIMIRQLAILLVPLVVRSAAPTGAASPAAHPLASVAADLRPVKWTLIGNKTREVVAGRTTPITVQAEIAKGWHIYSLTQKAGGPIPLRIELVGAPDLVVRGVINAPKPERKFDKNFGLETELYSGKPRFAIPVGVSGRGVSGTRNFQIGARYQVCSDKLCLPARTDKLDVALRIVSR